MEIFVKAVNWLNERVGVAASFLILPMVFVVAYEVVRRYVFNSPTSWGFELSTYIYGVHFMLGAAYTHLHDGHVAIDVVVDRLPRKPKLWMRIITFVILFFPFVGILSYESVQYALASWSIKEHSWSAWRPPIYPVKTLMAIGFVLLLLQGIAKFLEDIRGLRRN